MENRIRYYAEYTERLTIDIPGLDGRTLLARPERVVLPGKEKRVCRLSFVPEREEGFTAFTLEAEPENPDADSRKQRRITREEADRLVSEVLLLALGEKGVRAETKSRVFGGSGEERWDSGEKNTDEFLRTCRFFLKDRERAGIYLRSVLALSEEETAMLLNRYWNS